MRKILLIFPYTKNEALRDRIERLPPLGLETVASAIRDLGNEIRIVDMSFEPDIEEFIKNQRCPTPKICPEFMSCIKEEEKTNGVLPIKLQLYAESSEIEELAKKVRKVVEGRANALVSSPKSIEVISPKRWISSKPSRPSLKSLTLNVMNL